MITDLEILMQEHPEEADTLFSDAEFAKEIVTAYYSLPREEFETKVYQTIYHLQECAEETLSDINYQC